jgi:7-carboxy-7-deazaguanine synthase
MGNVKTSLIVSEVFYSIQGEGQCAGISAVFLRLAGCNLLCSGVGWVCDTIEVWKKGRHTYFQDVLPVEYIQHLENGAHLVITGGEPLLHQEAIGQYLVWFMSVHNFKPIIEIETNGTIVPEWYLSTGVVNYWNVSFKLSTSGEPYEKRVNELALTTIGRDCNNVSYKVVISREEDILELFKDFLDTKLIDESKVMLMPAGSTQDELTVTRPIVVEACKAFNLGYTDRLHIVIWNKKTGV